MTVPLNARKAGVGVTVTPAIVIVPGGAVRNAGQNAAPTLTNAGPSAKGGTATFVASASNVVAVFGERVSVESVNGSAPVNTLRSVTQPSLDTTLLRR